MGLSVWLTLPDGLAMANGLTSSYLTSAPLGEVSLFHCVVPIGPWFTLSC